MPAHQTITGLDIGRYAIKAVRLQRSGNGGVRLTHTAKLKIPRGTRDLSGLIEPWLAQNDLHKQACVLGVPGHQCMFQPFVLPPNDPRQAEQVADMEVIRFNEMASESMMYGHTATETNPGERLLLLAMTRPVVLSELLASAKALRLDAIDLIPDPAAVFQAMNDPSAHSAPTLFVHIGHGSTDIAVGHKNGLLFARTFASGGQAFTDALADALGIAGSKAEDMKLTQGALKSGTPHADLLTAAASAWMEELHSCLSVYTSVLTSRQARPATLAVSGGGALLSGLPEFAAERLGLNLLPPPDWALQEDAGQFSVAYGLARGGLDPAGPALSLLPRDVRDDLVFRRQKPYWIASGLAAALILAVGLVGGLRDIGKKKAYYERQEAGLRVREGIAAEIDAVRAEQERLHAMTEPIVKFLRAGPQMRNLITLAANSLAPNDQIVLVCDADSFFDITPSREPIEPPRRRIRDVRRQPESNTDAEAQTPTFERVIIEGYTRTANLSTVRSLIDRLRKAEFVESADLLSDDVLATGQKAQVVQTHPSARHFVIEVKLTPL